MTNFEPELHDLNVDRVDALLKRVGNLEELLEALSETITDAVAGNPESPQAAMYALERWNDSYRELKRQE
jgi:hypothetical protein